MNTTLYYFTATGNNLAVTRDLAQELPGTIKIVSITKIIKTESIIDDSDIVGIIFPVYLRDIPPLVEEFAKRLEVNNRAFVLWSITD